MKPDDRINQLEEKKQEIISFTKELDEKLMLGEIDPVEYQVMMNEKYPDSAKEKLMNGIHDQMSKVQNQHSKNKKTRLQLGIAGAILVVIAIISIFSYQGSLTPTGFTIREKQVTQIVDYNQIFSQATETQLALNNITGLKISGKLEGSEARVKLRINGTDYLVAEIINPGTQNQTTPEQTPQYSISTDKTNYALGETATIIITPDTENKSLYVSYGEQTQKLDNNTYVTQEMGEHQAIALIVLPDNILRLETNFTVNNETINQTTPAETPELTPTTQPNTYEFTQLCTETCTLPENSNPILIIETAENSTLTITQITTTQTKENQAPIQTQNIPDMSMIAGQTTSLDLNQYFTDPENDTIQYDINNIPEIKATITRNILTITPATPGTYTAYIYATDGDKLVTSNIFTITITQEQLTPETNQTINETTSVLNETTGQTINNTNEIISNLSVGLDCSNPDPNQRPLECIEGVNSSYFKPEDLIIPNKGGQAVARLTPIGNILIRGTVIEHSTASPNSGDYQLGYVNDNGDYVPTLWIDSATGDLHLKGSLTETNGNIPSSGDFTSIANKKGIILALINRQTGDLIVRGNIIPYRGQLK